MIISKNGAGKILFILTFLMIIGISGCKSERKSERNSEK